MITVRDYRAEKIHELAQTYSAEGFQVVAEPGPGDLPFELEGYLPDLVARKGDGGFLVHVRGSGRRQPVGRLVEVVEEVRRHPGWGFLLVTDDDVAGEGVPGEDDVLPSSSELRERAAVALALADSGVARDAAFLALWAALEGLLRRTAEESSLPVRRLPTSGLIRHLYSHGALPMEQYDRALELMEVRDRVVHGYREPALEQATARLAALVRALLAGAVERAA